MGSIVIPAIEAPSSVTAIRSLGRRGVHTIAISDRPSARAFCSRYCDEAIEAPSPVDDADGYRDALLALAARADVRTIVPMREADVYVLSNHRDAFAEHVACLWPAFETLHTVHDRIRLARATADAGVRAPGTRLLEETDDWNRKLVVKARYGLLAPAYLQTRTPGRLVESTPVRYLEPGVEPDREAIRAEFGHEPIVQEYVPGTEYALWALYDRGEPVATCGKRQLRAWEYAGGTSICRETVRDPDLEAAGRTLLDHLDWHGLASVQFVRDAETGEFVLLEVNPRAWISLSCPVLAGVDFPYYFWQLAVGQPVRPNVDYEKGVATHLLWGEVGYLRSILRDDFGYVERPSFRSAMWDVASSLYAQPHLDFLGRDDPCPFVCGLRNVVAGAVG